MPKSPPSSSLLVTACCPANHSMHRIPAREVAVFAVWLHWLHLRVIEAFDAGRNEPYTQLVQAAQAAHCALMLHLAEDAHRLFGRAAGRGAMSRTTSRHVIAATGTASGKSLSYLMPAFDVSHQGITGELPSATADT